MSLTVVLASILCFILLSGPYLIRVAVHRSCSRLHSELIDLRAILIASLDSSQQDAKVKITYVIEQLRQLV